MRTFTLIVGLFFLSIVSTQSQVPNNDFYVNSIENDVNTFLKASENPDYGKSWFRLTGSMGYSPILIAFLPGATDNYEDTYDGVFINEGCLVEFYSYCEPYKLEVQGRSELQTSQQIQIPLGYQVVEAGDYIISIVLEYIDSNFEILLEDTLKGITTDLRISDYSFSESNPTEDNNRFIVHYNFIANEVLEVDTYLDISNNINSYFNNDKLFTKVDTSIDEPKRVQLFDVLGNEVLNVAYSKSIQVGNLSSGIYIIKYEMEDYKTISKKLLKRQLM